MQDPFELEKIRHSLAKDGNLIELKSTYRKGYPEIKNLNTSTFWNNLLEKEKDFKQNLNPMFLDKVNIIKSFFRKRHGRLLDLGFGTGRIEKELERDKCRLKIWGLDISSQAVVEARKSLRGNFTLGSVLSLPYKTSFFDFVIVLDVMEHIPPSKTLRVYSEIYRVLREGGQLIVSVPLNEGLEELVKKGKNPNGHVRVYTPEILKAELKLFRFRVFKEIKLYAFRKDYKLKSWLINVLPLKIRNPNLLIVFARK